MKTKEISIIVPIYNAEKFLPEAIESLINQTFKEHVSAIKNVHNKEKKLSVENSSPTLYEIYAKTPIYLIQHIQLIESIEFNSSFPAISPYHFPLEPAGMLDFPARYVNIFIGRLIC